MTRYHPSLNSVLCVLLVLAAVALEIFVLTPHYNATFDRHRALKEQLKAVQRQHRNADDAIARLQQRLAQPPTDDKALLDELARFRAAARLENAAYSLGAPQDTVLGDTLYRAQRLELDITAPSDTHIWQFLNLVVDQSMYAARIETLRVTRSTTGDGDAVQAMATAVFYRLGDQ